MEKIFRFTFENETGSKCYEVYTLEEILGNKDAQTVESYWDDGYTLVKWDEQYVGYDDVEGNLIFENDVVEFLHPRYSIPTTGTATLKNNAFVVQTKNYTYYRWNELMNLKVIV